VTGGLRNKNKIVSTFSEERRADLYEGGTIPAQWQAQCIDLDSLIIEVEGIPYIVGVDQKVFVQYDKPARIISIVETKNPGEERGSRVTFELARLANIPGYCVIRYDDHLIATRHDGEVFRFDSVKDFVSGTHVNRRRS